jgi:hypothetical protein
MCFFSFEKKNSFHLPKKRNPRTTIIMCAINIVLYNHEEKLLMCITKHNCNKQNKRNSEIYSMDWSFICLHIIGNSSATCTNYFVLKLHYPQMMSIRCTSASPNAQYKLEGFHVNLRKQWYRWEFMKLLYADVKSFKYENLNNNSLVFLASFSFLIKRKILLYSLPHFTTSLEVR